MLFAVQVTDEAISSLVTSMFGKETESKGDGGATMRLGQTTVKITKKNDVSSHSGPPNAWSVEQMVRVRVRVNGMLRIRVRIRDRDRVRVRCC